ncbi:MAG: hypothetical protein HZA02_03500 [Nitrospinae bacterium]|nr:hypothetical protein [Nitrospinota bacterium]
MRMFPKFAALALSLSILALSGQWNALYSERKYYEAPKDYREQIDRLKAKFKESYGYELFDLDAGWKKEEIVKLDEAFAPLPAGFFRLPGLNGLYRTSRLAVRSQDIDPDEAPSGAFPAFATIFRQAGKSYNVYVDDEDPRVELYNNLMYKDPEDFQNIVQHEMGHAFDLTNGFLSFSPEWLAVAHFRILHLPALDGKENSDFIYAMLNDPETDAYAPVSVMHIPTYSRQNPQEDFANSVAAYIQYPYFRYSHPGRYRFLKDKVFGGKEYFPESEGPSGYEDRVLSDLEKAIGKNDWDGVVALSTESSRSHNPKLQARILARLRQAADAIPAGENASKLAVASCFNYEPEALELRQDLIRKNKTSLEDLLKNEQCFRVSRELFENAQALWPVQEIYFYRENGKAFLQFLDPAILVARARGFQTIYNWKLYLSGSRKKPVAEGKLSIEGGNGAVRIDLGKTADGKFKIPEGEILDLELEAQRHNIKTFKTLAGKAATIRFVVQPWFNYIASKEAKARVVYPVRAAYQGK